MRVFRQLLSDSDEEAACSDSMVAAANKRQESAADENDRPLAAEVDDSQLPLPDDSLLIDSSHSAEDLIDDELMDELLLCDTTLMQEEEDKLKASADADDDLLPEEELDLLEALQESLLEEGSQPTNCGTKVEDEILIDDDPIPSATSKTMATVCGSTIDDIVIPGMTTMAKTQETVLVDDGKDKKMDELADDDKKKHKDEIPAFVKTTLEELINQRPLDLAEIADDIEEADAEVRGEKRNATKDADPDRKSKLAKPADPAVSSSSAAGSDPAASSSSTAPAPLPFGEHELDTDPLVKNYKELMKREVDLHGRPRWLRSQIRARAIELMGSTEKQKRKF